MKRLTPRRLHIKMYIVQVVHITLTYHPGHPGRAVRTCTVRTRVLAVLCATIGVYLTYSVGHNMS